jgi:membrane protease YdiL (CAAX protease family)
VNSNGFITYKMVEEQGGKVGRPPKGQLALFLSVTFALSWGAALLPVKAGGEGTVLRSGLPPFGMLVPAFVALVVEMFISKKGGLYFRKYTAKPSLILFAYLLLTLLTGFINLLAAFPGIPLDVLRGVGNVLFVLWTLLLIRLYRQSGEAAFRQAGLQLGDTQVGVRFVIGIVVFLLSQAALNWLFGLGEFQGVQGRIEGIPVPATWYFPALFAFLLLAIIGTPLGGLAATFGEEYAWRGFLQRRLEPFGRRRGAFLIGLIWGIWHLPIILSGVHTYPPTPFGFLSALIFFTLWGYIQSYAVLKTGSIWVPVFLHGVVNSVYAFTLTYLVRPEDKLFSFGLGIYGLALLGVIVLLVLRDPVWKSPVPVQQENNLSFAST